MKRSLLMALALAAGCLGPRSDPSAFFLLSPAPAPEGATPVPVALGIGPVSIPAYLDRPELVVRVDENQITLAGADRWAEPLGDNIVRTLEENLGGLLPGSSYVDYPWFESESPDYAVSLDVHRFEVDVAGTVVLEAEWWLRDRDGAVDGGSARIMESAAGAERVDGVAAQSRALAELSRRIAARLRSASGR